MRNRKERVSSLTTAPQKHAVAMLFTYRPQRCQADYAFGFITRFFFAGKYKPFPIMDGLWHCFTMFYLKPESCGPFGHEFPNPNHDFQGSGEQWGRHNLPRYYAMMISPFFRMLNPNCWSGSASSRSWLQLVCWIWGCFEERTGTKQMVIVYIYIWLQCGAQLYKLVYNV